MSIVHFILVVMGMHVPSVLTAVQCGSGHGGDRKTVVAERQAQTSLHHYPLEQDIGTKHQQ